MRMRGQISVPLLCPGGRISRQQIQDFTPWPRGSSFSSPRDGELPSPQPLSWHESPVAVTKQGSSCGSLQEFAGGVGAKHWDVWEGEG